MTGANFRDTHGFDPDDYSGNGGGLPGMLWRAMQGQGVLQPGVGAGSIPTGGPGYGSGDDDSPQGGLLGRLLALHAEQSQYQPSPAGNGQSPFAPQSPNPSQGPAFDDTSASGHQAPLRRIYIYAPTDHDAVTEPEREEAIDPSSTSPSGSGTSSAQGGLPGGLVGLRSEQSRYQPIPRDDGGASSPQVSTPMQPPQSMPLGKISPSSSAVMDPIDIGKSLAIGAANGLVNSVGLPADALTGFGYFPRHLVENLVREKLGYPDLPHGQPGNLDMFTSSAIRHGIESHWGEFYQPKSRAGRYAETIGEMLPMAVGGGVASLRQLPGTLLKHAVAPAPQFKPWRKRFRKQSREDPSESVSDRASRYSIRARSNALSRQADRPILIQRCLFSLAQEEWWWWSKLRRRPLTSSLIPLVPGQRVSMAVNRAS
jgi:hypothetical protein